MPLRLRNRARHPESRPSATPESNTPSDPPRAATSLPRQTLPPREHRATTPCGCSESSPPRWLARSATPSLRNPPRDTAAAATRRCPTRPRQRDIKTARRRSSTRCRCLARSISGRCRPVALPLLPCLQGEHRAFATCVAAPAPARAGHAHAARYRRIGRLNRSGPRLRLPNRFRRSLQENDRRNPERLAQAHALAAISQQVRQSLWGSRRLGPLDKDHRVAHANNQGDGQWPGRI